MISAPKFDNSYAKLPESFYETVSPATVPAPALLAFNHELAGQLGIDTSRANDEDIAAVFSGNTSLAGAQPIAMAYAGHQFAQFVPQLGDGRALLIGEVLDRDGRRFDVQLKGSGRTPFSRGGDGKSWIGPVIREYVVSEAMYRLGVPTTRALAAVGTGETVFREEPLPGGVFTRVAASHIRVGTFQYFAARSDTTSLQELADYTLARHYPEAREADAPWLAMFELVVAAQARLVAAWLAVGFVHGVMNTDNTAVSGETIDYGPCAFLDEFNGAKVFSSIDRRGRYAYGRQPSIAQWNLARFAECLLMIDDRQSAYEEVLAGFGARFETEYEARMRQKLGLSNAQDGDEELIRDWLDHLQENELDYTLSFRELAERADADDTKHFGEFESRWRARLARQELNVEEVRRQMNSVNPLIIPRNHQVERAIATAVGGDLSVFEALQAALDDPYSPAEQHAEFARAPEVAERVTQTFCGT